MFGGGGVGGFGGGGLGGGLGGGIGMGLGGSMGRGGASLTPISDYLTQTLFGEGAPCLGGMGGMPGMSGMSDMDGMSGMGGLSNMAGSSIPSDSTFDIEFAQYCAECDPTGMGDVRRGAQRVLRMIEADPDGRFQRMQRRTGRMDPGLLQRTMAKCRTLMAQGAGGGGMEGLTDGPMGGGRGGHRAGPPGGPFGGMDRYGGQSPFGGGAGPASLRGRRGPFQGGGPSAVRGPLRGRGPSGSPGGYTCPDCGGDHSHGRPRGFGPPGGMGIFYAF
jgi:hypothetical protein